MTKCSPMPELLWEPAPCPQCGAADMDEANDKCRPTTDETGERSCGGEFRDDGISIQPTASSIAILDAWIDVHHDCIGKCVGVSDGERGSDNA